MHPYQIKHAAHIIKRGGVVAAPTEAVFGLSCDPLDSEAVSRILQLKQRPASKGLILIASDTRQLEPFVDNTDILKQSSIQESWPGPVTWLVPANPDVPAWLTGNHDTIAVRVTDHPVMSRLCEECGHALVSTSANGAGQDPARNALQTRRIFGDALDWILHADTGGNTQVSEIREAISGNVVR